MAVGSQDSLVRLDTATGAFVEVLRSESDPFTLGDVLAVPAAVPMANVFSIGDVLILVGFAYGLHHLCGSRLIRGSRRVSDGLSAATPLPQ